MTFTETFLTIGGWLSDHYPSYGSEPQRIVDLKAKKAQIVDALINESGISTLSLTKTDIESLLMPVGVEV